MTDQSENTWMGVKLPTGWFSPLLWQGFGSAEAQAKSMEKLAASLQKVIGEACSHNMETAVRANERVTQSLQALMRCRQPQELATAESNLIVALFESVAKRAEAWAGMAQNLGGCWADWAKEISAEKGGRQEVSPTELAAAPRRSAGR